MSEKTEQPTPQKLRQARENGQLARSRLLSSAVVTFAGLAGLFAIAPTASARLQAWTSSLFMAQQFDVTAVALEGLAVAGLFLGPPLLAALVGAVVASAAQAGFQVHMGLLTPKLERINPAEGFKRLFSARPWVDTGKNLLIAALISWLLWADVQDAAGDGLRVIYQEGGLGLLVVLELLRPVLLKLCAILVVLGGADYLLERHRHTKDLMMTREEVKQEYKNSEGDPHNKSKRKALHKALANSGPARGVHKATAVVVNPTHIAVALRYAPEECEAPYIVASGRDEDAFAIRREAKRQGVPVVKDIPLARSLIHYDVGEEIPEELYRAAAAVLKEAMEERETDTRPRSRTS